MRGIASLEPSSTKPACPPVMQIQNRHALPGVLQQKEVSRTRRQDPCTLWALP